LRLPVAALLIVGLATAPPHALMAGPVGTPIRLSINPHQITFTQGGDGHRLIVTGHFADGSERDLTRAASYTSGNSAVAIVAPDGVATPQGVGEVRIEAAVNALRASTTIRVSSTAINPVSFVNDVMPVLSKAGCNQGACHGAASGKKGFKLSLRGYDPAADFQVLTRGIDARRLNRNDAGNSLIVLKGTGRVPHEGGKLFDGSSRYAKLLERWIAEGARSDLADSPALIDLQVFPNFRTAPEPGLQQQLLVLAKFGDGSTRDVTAEARYASGNENVAAVDESGLVTLLNRGEAAIAARYGSRMAVSTLVALRHDPKFRWPEPPEVNYVDRLVCAKLKQMQIEPSNLCGDAEFLRRVCYDLIGLPPAPDEVRKFLADPSREKRARKIDELLDRPEHAEYWALKWCDLFKVRFDTLGDRGTWGLYRLVRDHIAANKPFDRLVRELLTAEGSCAQNAAANFYRVFNNPDEASEATVQIFCGVRLLCARCHDHPFEKWVQKDYYGMAAFFSQLGSKPGARSGDLIIFHNDSAPRARHPKTGEVLLPKLLDADSLDLQGDQDARGELARWLTRKDNPFFARATVNRLWSHLFGKGIIDPVDDIRSSNPPANAPLLDALAKDFADHDFDVRYILRVMLNSRTYQLSALTTPTNADDVVNFSHRLPRRLGAEQILDTIGQVTGVRQGFRSRYGEATVALPATGARAGQLPDRQLTAETLDLFGRPRGESSCACERHEEASMTQALHLINSKSVLESIHSPGGTLGKLVGRPKITDEQIVEELYLLALCRPPTEKEVGLMKKHFETAGSDKLKAAQDVLWVLLNCKEFLFNH
jgi:Protein of unknown function (DUF1549)/Protein of unknown function (DUF1553)